MRGMVRLCEFVLLALCVALPVTAAEDAGLLAPDNDEYFGDEVKFLQIEDNCRTIELCMASITKLSNKPWGTQKTLRKQEDHASNKIMRFVRLKEEAAERNHVIISDYFMTYRVRNWPDLKKNPEGYASREYEDFTKMLEYLQSALTYNMWCKQLTMPGKARAVRGYMDKFRKLWEKPENRVLRRGKSFRTYLVNLH